MADTITRPAEALDALDIIEAAVPERHEARDVVARMREWVRSTESRAALSGLLDRVDGSLTATRDELGQWRPVVAPVLAAHVDAERRRTARAEGSAGLLALAKTPAGYTLALALAGMLGAVVQWVTGITPQTAPQVVGGAPVEAAP